MEEGINDKPCWVINEWARGKGQEGPKLENVVRTFLYPAKAAAWGCLKL